MTLLTALKTLLRILVNYTTRVQHHNAPTILLKINLKCRTKGHGVHYWGLIQNFPVILHKNNCKTSINTSWTDYPSNAQLLSLCPWDQWASRACCLCSSVIPSHLNARSVCPSQPGWTACGWGSAEELTFFPHPVFTRVFRLACLVFRGCALVFLAPMPNSPKCARSNWAKNQTFDKQSGAKFSVYVTLI